MGSITSFSYDVVNLNEGAYQLNMQFYAKNNKCIESQSQIFYQNECQEDYPLKVFDIWTINGRQTEKEGLKLAVNKKATLEALNSQLPLTDKDYVCAVVDIKKLGINYLDKETVSKIEEKACNVLAFNELLDKEDKTFNDLTEINAAISCKTSLDYVILEGTLKANLLTSLNLSENAISFLNKKKEVFCELTEVYMNALKFGDVTHSLNLQDYKKNLSKKISQPVHQNILVLPNSYRRIYEDPSCKFYSLKTVFDITLGKKQEHCFTLNVAKEMVK